MKVPLRWLQEFVDLPTTEPAELSDALDAIGDKVEGYEILEADWSDVVVGQVVEIAEHPDADKIRVCQVDTGSGPAQIICGAWNFEEGAYVAVARPGAVLPGDLEISQRTIRGVESNGMICSEKELGLGYDHAGILVLDGEPELGVDFADQVELPDVVFDLEITPNRSDAMSLLGIARDLAAYYEIPYQVPDLPLVTTPGATDITVEIGDPLGCRRFTAREIRGVTMGYSPLKVRHRLSKVGVRSISGVVDVTNYVMFELGHPLHAFDADSVAGRALVVKRAESGESLETLDGDTHKLTEEDLIIYDSQGPTSMSGTMGGARSEVSGETTNVLMEAASWDPPTIMYMSRRHGLRSEASTRFERGVDPNLADESNKRASAMVAQLAGGEVLEGSIDVVGTVTEPVTVELHMAEVERLLGPGFESGYVAAILSRLGMEVTGDDPITVQVPTYRPDVTRQADLIEEVARIHGFDKFASTLPTGPAGGLTAEQRRLRSLRATLVGAGLSQAVTLSFIGEDDLMRLGRSEASLLRVKNPLREEEGLLRPSILPSLLNAAKYNFSHGARSVALFETGRVFSSSPSPGDPRLPHEIDRLAWVVAGPTGVFRMGADQLEPDAQFSIALARHMVDVLGVEEVEFVAGQAPGLHPGRTALVVVGDTEIGHVGEMVPSAGEAFDIPGRVAVAEIDLDPILKPIPAPVAQEPSVFPHVDFDLSFLTDVASPVTELMAATTSAASGLVESATVFDEFRGETLGEGKRAVAIRYRLRAADRTLTSEDLAAVRSSMIEAADGLGAILRGT